MDDNSHLVYLPISRGAPSKLHDRRETQPRDALMTATHQALKALSRIGSGQAASLHGPTKDPDKPKPFQRAGQSKAVSRAACDNWSAALEDQPVEFVHSMDWG